MATLHSLLALYGALDDAVTTSGDPQVAQTVESFLPGTTGLGRQGWFTDIRNFVRRLSLDPDQTEFPSRTAALREFSELSSDSDDFEMQHRITAVEMTRFLYVVGAHWRLSSRADDERDLFAHALSIAVPGGPGPDSIDSAYALLDMFRGDLDGAENFAEVISAAFAHDPPLVSEDVLLYVLNSTLEVDVRRDACGEYAMLKAEYFRDHLQLQRVKDVVDPLNWNRCCPFFCAMTPIPKTPDGYGWSRVLEVVSTLCGLPPFASYGLKTAIKYWNGERPGGAFVNYDLDDNRANTGDDGLTLVDRGYISFEEERQGVRIRTLKEVKFAGMPAIATIMFAIIGGYASIGENMLVGCALSGLNNAVGWRPSAPTDKPAKPFDPTRCLSAPAPCEPCGCTGSFTPAVAEAVDLWTDCVTEVSTEYAGLVNRWAKCGFDPAEMVDFGTKMSARMATDPWRFLALTLGSGLQQHKGH